MKAKNAASIIDKFAVDKKNDIHVYQSTKKSDEFKINTSYDKKSDEKQMVGTVRWNPELGLKFRSETGEKGKVSAAVILIHEFGHGENVKNKGVDGVLQDKNIPLQRFDNVEESDAIGYENQVALKMGEDIRDSHSGHFYKTANPTTTKKK